MEIVREYPMQVEQWVHLPSEKFLGKNIEYELGYILGITPEDFDDPECCYFNVWVEKKIENEGTGGTIWDTPNYISFNSNGIILIKILSIFRLEMVL